MRKRVGYVVRPRVGVDMQLGDRNGWHACNAGAAKMMMMREREEEVVVEE
jgi:hypothetical protein